MIQPSTQTPWNLNDSPAIAAIPFPFADEVLFQIGPVAIRWYALSYIAGILIGWFILRLITRPAHDPVGHSPLESLLNAGIIGIILGGRLAYVLFYNLPYYASQPLEALAVWKGGMSFHGGMLGMIGAVYIVSRRHRIRFLQLADLVAIVAPIGLFLGRTANFINCELYGRITDMPWGVVFNQGTCIKSGDTSMAGDLPRHPSQIYEALLEGLMLFIIMLILLRLGARQRLGRLSGIFLTGYGLSRSVVELFREPDSQLGFLISGTTMGQWLSLPMVIAGLYLIIQSSSASRHIQREAGK
jgi:phosphatidylglycerol:prolipoprotein diacylglycerol transferase